VKDRVWFFLSYQGSRERNGTSLLNSIGTVFVPAVLTNDRSDAGIAALGAAFGVPAVNPTAQFLLQATLPNGAYVIPSAPSNCAALVCAVPVVGISKFHEDQFNANLDFQVSTANRFSANFFGATNPTTQALFNLFGLTNALPVPGFGGTADLNQRVLSLEDTDVISPHVVNEARFGVGVITTGSSPQEPYSAANVGITSPMGNLFAGMPEISVANFFDVGANPFSDNTGIEKTYSAGDNISWQKGRHNIKAGAEYKHHELNATFNLYTRGQIFDLGIFNAGAQFGDSFYTFLGGANEFDVPNNADFTIMGSGVNNRDIRAQDWNGFFNNDWRISNQLTLTLGLRYDFFGEFTEAQGRFVGFDPERLTTLTIPGFPAGDNTAITGGFVQASNAKTPLPGVPLVSPGLVPSVKKDFAPRIGFAWQPLPNSKRLVVRGGYGLYYDRANSRLLNNQLLNFPYYTLAQTFLTPIATPFVDVPPPSAYPLLFNNPAIFPFGGPPALMLQAPTVLSPGGLAVVSANGIYPDLHDFRTPDVQQYSLGVQDEFAHNWLLDLSYVGSAGRKEYRLVDLNQAVAPGATTDSPYGPGLSAAAVQGFGVHAMQSSSNSSYNSLQVGVTKRFSSGLQFLAAYTWSHSIDDYSGDATGTSDVSVVPGNEAPGFLNNRASSDYDRRQRLVFSGSYDLPTYKGGSGVVRQAVNGWQLNTVLTLQSGTPFSVLTNETAFVQARADSVAGCNPVLSGSVESRLNGYFNAACFTPATVDFGDTGRNIIRGPNQKNVDISVVKFFPLVERTKLEFRAEFFNAFNMASFANPVNIVESANDGQIVTTTTGPRVIQFALKLNF